MGKFTYAMSNWIFGEEDLNVQYARLAKYGYDAIELMVDDHATFDTARVQALGIEYSLPCCSLCTLMPGTAEKPRRRNLIDQDPEVRENTIDFLKGCVDIGVELGAKVVLAVITGVANVTDPWTPANVQLAANALREIGEHAESVGDIVLALEPLNRYENAFLRRTDQALELLEATNHPRVKCMIDFFHANIEEDDSVVAILMAGKNLVHCHIADSNRKSTGRGQTDWVRIFKTLKQVNFEGALACEPLPPSGSDVYVTKQMERPENERDMYADECITYLRFLDRIT
jgi:D-psicose/D-tagatose/L-ribulose 3-epimerase